jgi:hypothetical protein
MIGRIEVNGKSVVVMNDDGTFAAAVPLYRGVAAHMNLVAAADAVRQVGDGHEPYGHRALSRAAKLVSGGKVVYVDAKPGRNPGTIS